MVDMRDFPNFKYHEPPSSGGYKDFNKWFGDWQKWHEAKILAVAKFFHLQHCQTCLYNMIREKYFPGYPVLPHPKDN